jgi:hypothetical protein
MDETYELVLGHVWSSDRGRHAGDGRVVSHDAARLTGKIYAAAVVVADQIAWCRRRRAAQLRRGHDPLSCECGSWILANATALPDVF